MSQAKTILHVVQSAYRGTLEEQDDTILWLVQALAGAGAAPHVLLRGNAVNYLVRGQDASGLEFGKRRQTQPPRIELDLARMIEKGIAVQFVGEDLEDRGISLPSILPGARGVSRGALAGLYSGYDQIWVW
jgi:hypothetical protein